MAHWSNDLQCQWQSWSVVKANRLRLDLPPSNCCDMSGAIRLGTMLMAHVNVIFTYSGALLDVVYVKTTTGWEARRAPKTTTGWEARRAPKTRWRNVG
jgi:hypothetical protein